MERKIVSSNRPNTRKDWGGFVLRPAKKAHTQRKHKEPQPKVECVSYSREFLRILFWVWLRRFLRKSLREIGNEWTAFDRNETRNTDCYMLKMFKGGNGGNTRKREPNNPSVEVCWTQRGKFAGTDICLSFGRKHVWNWTWNFSQCNFNSMVHSCQIWNKVLQVKRCTRFSIRLKMSDEF